MIETSNGKIYIKDGEGIMIESTNAELIGLALLDYVSNGGKQIPIQNKSIEENEADLTKRYRQYLLDNKMTFTKERSLLLEVVLKTNDFEAHEFVRKATQLKTRIVPATCYNFLQTCVNADILTIQPKRYLFN